MDKIPALIVKTHAFGDALLCTPSVRALMREKKGRYWVLTGPSAADVWERMPGIERVFVAPVPFSSKFGGPGLIRWTLGNRKALREVDQAYVFQGAAAVRRWIRFLTGAEIRSSGSEPLGKWESVFPLREDEYAGISYSRISNSNPVDWRPEFPVRQEEKQWVERLELPGPVFAVAPGGGRNPRDDVPEKRWRPGNFAEIADRLAGTGFRIILLGGEGDSAASREMLEKMSGEAINMTGRTTWGQTAAILDRCSGFLGADSGTAHLATARSVPSVVLFGPTSSAQLFGPGLISPVASVVACSPCYSNRVFPGCTREKPVCMESISVDDTWCVLQKVIHENYCR